MRRRRIPLSTIARTTARRVERRKLLLRVLTRHSQADVARALNVNPERVHSWATGTLTVPERFVSALEGLVVPTG